MLFSWVSNPTRKLSPRKLLELSAVTCKDKGVASGKAVNPRTLCNEMLLEAIPRSISASKFSRYTVCGHMFEFKDSFASLMHKMNACMEDIIINYHSSKQIVESRSVYYTRLCITQAPLVRNSFKRTINFPKLGLNNILIEFISKLDLQSFQLHVHCTTSTAWPMPIVA